MKLTRPQLFALDAVAGGDTGRTMHPGTARALADRGLIRFASDNGRAVITLSGRSVLAHHRGKANS